MKNQYVLALAVICCLLIPTLLAGCVPSPDNVQIEAAIQASLSDLTAEQLAEIEFCDLGGDTLVLLVPKYEGTVL